MSKSALPVAIGACTVLLASACSSPPQRDAPAQVRAPEVPDRQAGGNTVAAAHVQPDPNGGDAAPPSQTANVERSPADVDKDMKKHGYKPATYRGERVYCRNEALTGSNLESKVCLTVKQIEELERSGKEMLNGNRQAGCVPTKSGCN